jgi:hypothetical protein
MASLECLSRNGLVCPDRQADLAQIGITLTIEDLAAGDAMSLYTSAQFPGILVLVYSYGDQDPALCSQRRRDAYAVLDLRSLPLTIVPAVVRSTPGIW